MSDQDTVNIVLTENDAKDESDDESEEEIPSTFHLLLIFWQ